MHIWDKIENILKTNVKDTEITLESRMDDLGFTSLTFIKFVVEVELAFNFEFDDELLNFERFETMKDLVLYISSNVVHSDEAP